MAQILSFPGKTLPVDASRDQAARSVARRQIESATADFDRMMAHHADLERRVDEFNRLCAEAFRDLEAAERRSADDRDDHDSAEVLCHPAFYGPAVQGAALRCA
ncbi:hypothetical protein [Azospirillum rugosum]|uniref:Uncharacterized protein n=1 Tax=Azospirillum rugosum TaxID=416170 RepID=A0ABS4SLL6_9PROT|nr:hypothetical protein [Azospirillum rugosum]MBP2293458.1 hypothetical protein [Azospirillum rugosum]MDQ0530229.1 hypothetical protein [Azospirillum rugosum]